MIKAFWISVFLMLVAVFCGWVMNLIELFHTEFTTGFTGVLILRVIGVFIVPLGGVMGYL